MDAHYDRDTGKLRWKEYYPPHKYAGIKKFFEENELVRVQYGPPHPEAGLKRILKDGYLVRSAWYAPHVDHGKMEYYESSSIRGWEAAPKDKVVRTVYLPPHPKDVKEKRITRQAANRRAPDT